MQQRESFFSHQPELTSHLSLDSGLRFWTACLVLCSLLAAASGGATLLVITLAFARLIPTSSWLSTGSSVSGAASVLFLILSGHCMDKAEDADRAIKFKCWRDEDFPLISAGGSPTDAALGYKSL
jgi:hypothetical protein